MTSCDHACRYQIENLSTQKVNITITPPPEESDPRYNMWISKIGEEQMQEIKETNCNDSTFICQFTLEPNENVLVYSEFLGSGECRKIGKIEYTYEHGGSVTLEKDAVRKFFKEEDILIGRSFNFILKIE